MKNFHSFSINLQLNFKLDCKLLANFPLNIHISYNAIKFYLLVIFIISDEIIKLLKEEAEIFSAVSSHRECFMTTSIVHNWFHLFLKGHSQGEGFLDAIVPSFRIIFNTNCNGFKKVIFIRNFFIHLQFVNWNKIEMKNFGNPHPPSARVLSSKNP